MHDDILDQIAPLIELKRWLAYLNISPAMPSSNLTCPVRIEVMPQVYYHCSSFLSLINYINLNISNIDKVKYSGKIS